MRCTAQLLLALFGLWTANLAEGQVTFDEALALGAESPMGQRARRALAVREAGDASIGGTAQATTVMVMPGAVLTPDQQRGFDLQINATQGWNLADLGGARRDAADEERRALSARARAEALRARLEAAHAWIELRTLESLAAILAEQREVARRLVSTSERASRAGVATEADLADARAALAEVEQQGLELEGRRFERSTRLSVAMGRAGGSLRTAGAPPEPQLPALRVLRRRVASAEQMPSVVAWRLTALAARAREAEVSAQYAPVLQVGAQLERSASNAWTLYGIAGLSFNGFHQADRGTSLARAQTQDAATEAEAARLRARAELDAALHEVEHSRRRLQAIDEQLLPALIALRERRRRALELGEETVFVTLDSERRTLAGQELQARARGEQLWAEVRIWMLLAELDGGTESQQ